MTAPTTDQRFEFDFDPRFRWLLALAAVRRSTSQVTVTDDLLVARFGPWRCETPLANITCVQLTGPYRWYRAIGARGSLVDRGLTFGTTTKGGVCIEVCEAVRGLDPFGKWRHPGLTVTVADREGLATLLRQRCGLS
jgi:hypothetical protein